MAIFTFGNVDVHFSYYYSLHGKAVPQRIDFESIARDYVDFVESSPTQPYPSPSPSPLP